MVVTKFFSVNVQNLLCGAGIDQFYSVPGLMELEGHTKPDFTSCKDINQRFTPEDAHWFAVVSSLGKPGSSF
jgi:hypothetical protein